MDQRETGEVLLEIGFGEGLRWHDGELWFSDFLSRRVISLDSDWKPHTRAYIPGQPSGLGWAPDGTLLVVSMIERRLLRVSQGRPSPVADLGGVVVGPANDLYVDESGRAYVSSPGYEVAYSEPLAGPAQRAHAQGQVSPGALALVDTSTGQVRPTGDGLISPNGMVATTEGTLVVAESLANRLSEWDIGPDGQLSNMRTFAELEIMPDGLAIDANNNVWTSLPHASKFVCVARGGHILDEIPTPGRLAVACALGGADGQFLFGATTRDVEVWGTGEGSGAIEMWHLEGAK